MNRIMIAMFVLSIAPIARGGIKTETIEYKHGDVMLKGYLAYDPAVKEKRPGVLVVHEWWGLNEYAEGRARQLAALGYVAFAADMYGAGKNTRDADQARAWSGELYGKPMQYQRAAAGMKVLRSHQLVDPQRVAAIGYCFGGTTVLTLALSGADVAGVVSFHGNLPLPKPGADVTAKILVCHGADDPLVSQEQITAFQAALRKLEVDWQFIAYGGAVHSFTNPKAAAAGFDAVKYNKHADQRSWRHMQAFFDEIFKRP